MNIAEYFKEKEVAYDMQLLIKGLLDFGQEVYSHFPKFIDREELDQENNTGDKQIAFDVFADELFVKNMQEFDSVKGFVSEEQEGLTIMNRAGDYVLAYDPLDGSSLLEVNFSVGTIIGIYNTDDFLGKTGAQTLEVGMYLLYGPRLQAVIASRDFVIMLTFVNGVWVVSKTDLKIGFSTKYFAPGNLQGLVSNEGYKNFLDKLMSSGYKLRYSGGMIPDLHHVLLKESGIFMYPASKERPNGKLRLMYELIPMGYIVERAGGKTSNGEKSILDVVINDLHQPSAFAAGSKEIVDNFESIVGVL